MKDRLASLVVLALVSASSAAFAADALIPAKRLIVLSASAVVFDSKADTPYPIPPGGGGGDPTMNGGSLRIWDVGNPTNEEVYTLPAIKWVAQGPNRYKYNGAGTPADPCQINLRDDLITIDCDQATTTLTTPLSGEAGITLTLGASVQRYCAVMGGSLVSNRSDFYKRTNSPAPAVCEPTPVPFEEPLAAKVAVVKPQGLARFVSRPGVTTLPDTAGEAPVVVGGTVRVFDTDGGGAGDISYPLPANRWKTAGLGYKYRGPIGDPCPTVLLMPNVVKALCRREAVDLVPPFTGDAVFVITAGTDARYCVQFGGDEIRNDALVYKHKNADAPASCPSPSGAFLEVSADVLD
jgi:hypothetical protein